MTKKINGLLFNNVKNLIFIFYFLIYFKSFLFAEENSKFNNNKNSNFESVSSILPAQSVSAIFGQGVLIQDNYTLYINSLTRGFSWEEGYFQTDNLDTLLIKDANSGDWFLLPSSKISIQNQDKNTNIRNVILNYGNLRVKASKEISDNDTYSSSSNYKAEIETSETKITIPKGSDVSIIREKDKDKFFTQIIVFSGEVYLTPNPNVIKNPEKFKNLKIPLNSGLEFKMYEDGNIKPLSIPNSTIIENIIAFTTTQEELRKRYQNNNFGNLSEILNRASILADNEEYFELINLLSPIQNQMKKDIRIPYYLGFAKKGLYQTQDAKKYFFISRDMDNNYSMTHWQLGLIYLEEKNYPQAENEFQLAHKNLDPKSKVSHEYDYYAGVPYFFNNKLLLAKSSFQSAVRDTELDPSLRQSASEFLRKIDIDKPWTLIIPIGAQYDNNVLSIAQNQSLPTEYSQKSGYRSIAGALYTYDSSKTNHENGWFYGGAGKAFYVKNYPNSYSSLDSIVLEGSAWEINRWNQEKLKKEKEAENIRIYQTFGDIIVDNKQDTIYLLGGGVYHSLELNTGIQLDISDRISSQKKSSLVFNQYYLMGLGEYKPFVFDLNLQGQEQLMFQTSDTVGHTVEMIATPAVTYPINTKTSLKAGNTFDFLYTFLSPFESTYKFIPSISFNYFIYEWLIGTLSGSYEYDILLPENSNVSRPGASLMFTGIF